MSHVHDKTCQNCVHFLADDDSNGSYGECHRNPPHVFLLADDDFNAGEGESKIQTAWPMVEESDYCGEFSKF